MQKIQTEIFAGRGTERSSAHVDLLQDPIHHVASVPLIFKYTSLDQSFIQAESSVENFEELVVVRREINRDMMSALDENVSLLRNSGSTVFLAT